MIATGTTIAVTKQRRKMSIELIENSGNKHLDELRALLSASSAAVIASPFISEEAVDGIKKCFSGGFKELTLVTTMKQEGYDQVKKVPVLLKLYSVLKALLIKLTIKIDDDLHGKVYIGIKDDKYLGAIVTSANFTGNGLWKHHEWGVYFNEQEKIQMMCEQLLKETTQTIDENDLTLMQKWMREHQVKVEKNPKMKINLMNLLPPAIIRRGKKIIYWLKPLGTTDCPVPETMKFGEEQHDITFAKGVSNVKEDDVIIAYAVKTRKIISIFTATEVKGVIKVFKNKRDEKWPYYVKCDNHTRTFGANWSSENLTLDYLKHSFLRKNQEGEVRPGARDFNPMRRGLDRLKLTEEFAVYVINKVMERDRKNGI